MKQPERRSETYKCGTFVVERTIMDAGYNTRFSAPTDYALEATYPVDPTEIWDNLKQTYAEYLNKDSITKEEIFKTLEEHDPVFWKSLKILDNGELHHNKRIHIYTQGEIKIVSIDEHGNPGPYERDKENPGHIDRRGTHNIGKYDRIPKINVNNSKFEDPDQKFNTVSTALTDGATVNCISNNYNPQTLPTPYDFWKYDVHDLQEGEWVYIRPEGVRSTLLLLDGTVEINKNDYDSVQEFNITKECRITAKTPTILLFGAQQYDL